METLNAVAGQEINSEPRCNRMIELPLQLPARDLTPEGHEEE